MFFSARSTTVSSLIALLAFGPGISARTVEYRLQCLSTDNRQIIDIASCGDKGSIAYCLGNLQPTALDALGSQVQTCYLDAGCNEAEAKAEAARALTHCDPGKDGADLRKREGVKARDTESTPAAAQSVPKTAHATAQTTEKPATSSPPANARAVIRAATTTTRNGLAHSGRPIVCYTTSLSTTTVCPVQSTGSNSGKILSCFPTTIPTSVCAAGLICETDSNGNPSCMYKYNNLGVAGIAIATFFALAVTAAVTLIVTLCCREKKAQRRAERKAITAIAESMADKDEALLRAGDDRAALMGGDVAAGGAGPFGDEHRVR